MQINMLCRRFECVQDITCCQERMPFFIRRLEPRVRQVFYSADSTSAEHTRVYGAMYALEFILPSVMRGTPFVKYYLVQGLCGTSAD